MCIVLFLKQGSLSERVISVALLLLKVYPRESPVCEKVLRIYQRFCDVALPSEQLHREYSLATVSLAVWSLLREQEPDLFEHLQKRVDKDKDQGRRRQMHHSLDHLMREKNVLLASERHGQHARRRTQNQTKNSDLKQSAGIVVDMPPCLVLLQGWLESCFVGWLREHAVLFVCDQLIMTMMFTSTGGYSFQSALVSMCFILLKVSTLLS